MTNLRLLEFHSTFDIRIQPLLDFLNFLDGTFPCQHDQIAAELAGKFHSSGAVTVICVEA